MDGLYLHIPFCASKCAYCNFVSFPCGEETKFAYARRLIEEMNARKGEVDTVDSVYFGGGTPGQLPIRAFESICDAMRADFRFAAETEFTFETNPETVSADWVRALCAQGVNRVSLGLQSTRDALLQGVGRRHTYADFLRAVDLLAAGGIDNLSADLMLALPGQTEADVRATLDDVAPLPIAHWSVYSLKVEAGTPLDGYRVDEDFAADLYEITAETLRSRGFLRYETSNFARPGRECRHNLKYWTLAPYLGLGVAAHSDTRGKRAYNSDGFSAYMEGRPPVYTDIGAQERKEEYIMLSLRLAQGLDRAGYRARFGVDFVTERESAVAELVRLGCLAVDSETIRIPDDKTYVANAILCRLL